MWKKVEYLMKKWKRNNFVLLKTPIFLDRHPGGGVLPYTRYIGMCHPKGYGF